MEGLVVRGMKKAKESWKEVAEGGGEKNTGVAVVSILYAYRLHNSLQYLVQQICPLAQPPHAV